jgi:ABC-type sugar transport system ATPase subunit
MPEAKKPVKAPKAKVAKPKVAKAKPASKVAKGFADKPKINIIKASKTTKAQKPLQAAKPVSVASTEVKAKKARGPNKAKGSFADLLKIQSQYEAAKKGAKADLKKQYDSLVKEAESIKLQYKGLFNESIESASKSRGTGVKKTSGKIPGLKPFTLKEVEDFVDQKKEGVTIKIQGRRPKSIARMEDAYRHSEDAEEILKILNE